MDDKFVLYLMFFFYADCKLKQERTSPVRYILEKCRLHEAVLIEKIQNKN